jgi:hypothetical protein
MFTASRSQQIYHKNKYDTQIAKDKIWFQKKKKKKKRQKRKNWSIKVGTIEPGTTYSIFLLLTLHYLALLCIDYSTIIATHLSNHT